ncbi:FN3 associated domain-containing protein [Pedobacter sp. NJ-S-72]
MAEVCWTPLEKQSWTSFEKRMSSHYKRYDNAGFGYRVPQPKLVSQEKSGNMYVLKLENVVEGAQIRYTTDGTYPNVFSAVYTQPVQVEKLTDFKAITVVNRSIYSLPFYFPEKYEKFQKHGQFIAEWKPTAIKGKDYTTFEMNGSGKITANGEYCCFLSGILKVNRV